LAIDKICQDVYVGNDGEFLEHAQLEELQLSGCVSTSLRSSSILNPIIHSCNRLRDELDCYMPMIETSAIVMKMKVINYLIFAVQAKDDVQTRFGSLVMATASFGTIDESLNSVFDSDTGEMSVSPVSSISKTQQLIVGYVRQDIVMIHRWQDFFGYLIVLIFNN
jgi:hypothetical protein